MLLSLSILAPLLTATAVAQSTEAGARTKAVLELFTSQGCSSCPPADRLFQTFAKRPDVMALTMPVDYWDYLGWKDTMASPKHGERQRLYASVRGDGAVFTPQIIVNGRYSVLGSDKAAIERALNEMPALPIDIDVVTDGRMLTANLGTSPSAIEPLAATVWFAVVQPEVKVTIRRGENRGKIMRYYNVVRELTPIGSWTGQALQVEMPMSAFGWKGKKCVVFVQNGAGGPIVSAAWMREGK